MHIARTAQLKALDAAAWYSYALTLVFPKTSDTQEATDERSPVCSASMSQDCKQRHHFVLVTNPALMTYVVL